MTYTSTIKGKNKMQYRYNNLIVKGTSDNHRFQIALYEVEFDFPQASIEELEQKLISKLSQDGYTTEIENLTIEEG